MKKASLTVKGGAALRGEIFLPGDKSITHRALILGALAHGATTITNPSTALDCRATADALRALGVAVRWGKSGITVKGAGPAGFREPSGILDLANSGTGFRLLAGVLAGLPMFAVLDGDASLRRRPMGRIIDPLRLMGAEIRGRDNNRYPPLAVMGRDLSGLDYHSPVASAQVKSAVLLAGLMAQGITSVTEPAASRDHTERLLPSFGVHIARDGLRSSIAGPASLKSTAIAVPGDISSAAFWVTAALIVPGSRLIIRAVGLNPLRTGFLEMLALMGGKVSWRVTGNECGEPIGDIEAEHSPLRGISIPPEMIPACIDEIPILTVAAAAADGETEISGAGELRVKESDRIRAMAVELSKLGVSVTERDDGLRIRGGWPALGGRVDSHGDHRVAMSLAVLALASPEEVAIADTANIATSYPQFEATLKTLTAVA